MQDGPPHVGYAIFNVVELLVFNLILACSVYKIIRHRHALHIANVSAMGAEAYKHADSLAAQGALRFHTTVTPARLVHSA